MNLRRVLFEYELTQTEVAEAAVRLGYRMSAHQVSETVTGLKPAHPMLRDGIRASLVSLGLPQHVIDAIPEIVPRDRLRAGRKPKAVTDGKG